MNDKNNPVPVYVLSETGAALTDEGYQVLTGLVFSGSDEIRIDRDATGILAHTGKDLLDPAALIENLKASEHALVALSHRNGLELCDSRDRGAVISALEQAAETKTDSWHAVMRAAGLEVS